MNLILFAVLYTAFQPFCKPETTTGFFYVTHPAYNGSVTLGNNTTIVKKLNSSLETGKSSCQRDCTRDVQCLAYQFAKFTNYTECTLFSDNICANGSLFSMNVTSDFKESLIWEKINGTQPAMSCLEKQLKNLPQPDIAAISAAVNASLPADFPNNSPAPRHCKDYFDRGYKYDGNLVPVWPWGYGNGSVTVQCYGEFTAVFATHYFEAFLQKFYYVWILGKKTIWQSTQVEFDDYMSSMNFTLLSKMVNVPTSTPREIMFKVTCKVCEWGFECWPEYKALYSNFNILPNGTLQLGNFIGDKDGLGSNVQYDFSASGSCGKFWQLSLNDSCSQKTFLFRYQQSGVGLRWDNKYCTKAIIMFK